jgi:hypothetical protein
MPSLVRAPEVLVLLLLLLLLLSLLLPLRQPGCSLLLLLDLWLLRLWLLQR